jgi:hypothetical protein
MGCEAGKDMTSTAYRGFISTRRTPKDTIDDSIDSKDNSAKVSMLTRSMCRAAVVELKSKIPPFWQ